MLETKEQKQIFAGSMVLIVILGLVSFWHHPSLQYTDTTNYKALQAMSAARQKAYSDYLNQIGSTPEAQSEMFSEILPPAQVQAEIEQQLGTNQKIVIPSKPQTTIKVSPATGKAAIQSYLNASTPIVNKISAITKSSQNDFFNANGSVSQIDSLIADLGTSLTQYSKLSVPKEAVDFQNHELIAVEAYLSMAKTSKAYMQNPGSTVWPQMYKDFSILAQSTNMAGQNFQALNQKYNLLGDAGGQEVAKGNWLIPAASAQILTTDIWQKAQDALRIAAATAVAQFMLNFLNQLATKIQQAYRITNFLYYTDALVAGQYVNDYLNKYVNDPFDRTMIKNFIPSVSCGKTQNLTPVFQAKAGQYLGFDPQSLDPNDPNYYEKLSKVGNFLSSSQGWQLYYQDVAQQANSAATQAATNELNSQGNKSSRDVTGGILTTAQTTVDANRAVLQNMLASGFAGMSGDPWTAKIVSQITQTFLNTFVFQGTVLKEQKACISVPVVSFVSPLPLGSGN